MGEQFNVIRHSSLADDHTLPEGSLSSIDGNAQPSGDRCARRTLHTLLKVATGGHSGIARCPTVRWRPPSKFVQGFQAIKQLQEPRRLILGSRTAQGPDELYLDLRSRSSVETFAKETLKRLRDEPIHVLLLCAGIMKAQGHPAGTYGEDFAVNVLGALTLPDKSMPNG
jgi:hypothetical protein